MKICYIAPVAAATDMNMIEEAVYNAIQNTITIPFRMWILDTWINFVDLSFVLCLAVAITGAVCAILGIEKGKKIAILSIVFYFLLRLFSWAMGWY